MDALTTVLRSGEEELKPPVLDCIAVIAKVIKLVCIGELFAVLIPGIESDDTALSVACLRTIKALLSADPEGVRPEIAALFPKLEKRASVEYSATFLHSLSQGGQPMPQNVFSVMAISLKILGKITIKFPESFAELGPRLLDLCNVHKMSASPEVRRTVAVTVRFLAESESKAWNVAKLNHEDQKAGVKRLLEILLPMMSAEARRTVTCEVLRGATAIVAWFGYDMAEEFLGFFIETARTIITSPEVQKSVALDRWKFSSTLSLSLS
jgi:hypothetical protein